MSDCCCEKTMMILSCSKGADVGEVSDKVARKLGNETELGFKKGQTPTSTFYQFSSNQLCFKKYQ